MYKFHGKMIVQVHFYRDFTRKNILQPSGLELMTFQLMFSCLGITFLTEICIFPIKDFAPCSSQYSATA